MSTGIIMYRDGDEVRITFADEEHLSAELASILTDTSRSTWTIIGQKREEDGAAVVKIYSGGAQEGLAVVKRPGAPIRRRFAIHTSLLAELLETYPSE